MKSPAVLPGTAPQPLERRAHGSRSPSAHLMLFVVAGAVLGAAEPGWQDLRDRALKAHEARHLSAAEALYREEIAAHERGGGAATLECAFAHYRLGMVQAERGDGGQAERQIKRAIAMAEGLPGGPPAGTGSMYAGLGHVYVLSGDAGRAASVLRRGIDMLCRQAGEDHLETAMARVYLANLQLREGRCALAEAGFRRALQTVESRQDAPVDNAIRMRTGLAAALVCARQYQEAETALAAALAQAASAWDALHPDLMELHWYRGLAAEGLTGRESALPHFRRAYAIVQARQLAGTRFVQPFLEDYLRLLRKLKYRQEADAVAQVFRHGIEP